MWGLCNKEIFIRDGEVEADSTLSLCKSGRDADWRIGYDFKILSDFASGKLDLVVRSDNRSASRLSHEPWFLPPPEYRYAFCHVWIPKDVITRFDGKKLRLISDGNHVLLKQYASIEMPGDYLSSRKLSLRGNYEE